MYEQWEKEEAEKQRQIIAQIKAFETSTIVPSKLFNREQKYNSYDDVIFSKDEKEHLLTTKPSGTALTDDEFITECRHLICQHYFSENWLSNSETNKQLNKAGNAIKNAIIQIGKLDSDTQALLTSNFKVSLLHLFDRENFKGDPKMRLLPELLVSTQCAIELSTNKKTHNGHAPYVKKAFEDLVRTWETLFRSKATKTEGDFKEFVKIMFYHFGKVYEEPEKRIEEAIRNSRILDDEIEKAIEDSKINLGGDVSFNEYSFSRIT